MLSKNKKIEFIKKLKKKELKLYVAESITGGKFTSELVKIKGASKYLDYSIKTGSLSRSERVAKYNQLIRIEDRNKSIKFSGKESIKKFLNVSTK